MEGIFAIIKPKGPTSHDIIDQLRKLTGIKRIGHAGTLDPLAEGILVVGIGSTFTKKLGTYLKKEKEYLATIKLGEESSTDDWEGEKKKIPIKQKPSLDEICKILLKFKGFVMQKPPKFSAIKVSGKRAYKLARKGEEVILKARKIEIKEIEVKEYRYPKLILRIETGSGVYIRSIARDLGKKLNTGAYLKDLKRTKVGNFVLKDALTISQFKKNNIKKS